MAQTEKIKKYEARLEEIEQAKTERKKTYNRSLELLNDESNSIKAKLYDLIIQKK